MNRTASSETKRQADTSDFAAPDRLDAGEARERPFDVVASARMVNRTHRVVRERANKMVAQKKTMRSLYIPLGVSAGLLAVITFAVWSLLDQYEVTPTGLPDASKQILILLMWCLPVTGALLTVAWFRKSNGNTSRRGAR